MKRILLSLLLLSLFSYGQTNVVQSPVFQQQLFDSSGNVLAFGCVFSFNSGTSTPLATYTDSSGNTQNANPVILNSAGRANIWLQSGQAYSIKVISAGGSNCSTGSTIYTVNGVGGGTSQLTSIIPYSASPTFPVVSQNQLFTITLTGNAVSLPLSVVGVSPPSLITFQITQDAIGSHTFTWPSGVVGGGTISPTVNAVTTQEFLWNGTTANAIGPAITGSTILATNLNVSGTASFSGATTGTWTGPVNGTVGATTPSTVGATSIFATSVQAGTVSGTLDVIGALFGTFNNCAANGTAASPSVVSCGVAAAGSFSCSVSASTGFCIVNTGAADLGSQIFVTQNTSDGSRLGVTCNNTGSSFPPFLLASKAIGSFTIYLPTFSVTPTCYDFFIVN